jgi:hypothetical protein
VLKDSRSKKGRAPRVGTPWLGPVLVALAAWVATVATLQPGLTGPGVTCDELYHVIMGKQAVMALRHHGLGQFFSAANWQDVKRRADEPPVHPPLGNWILGGLHHLFDVSPDDVRSISIAGARFAPALALGLLSMMVGLAVVRREGGVAGTVAAVAVVLMPRTFAHGHLAALDMLTTLFFVAAVLAAAEAERWGGRLWQFALAGGVWGLAMLVRLHGVLLLPPIAAWILWRRRRSAWGPLVCWFAAGTAAFFAGWPWLWAAPLSRLGQFLASGTQRQVIHVFYWGRVWADREVPWHYPLVMFLVTVPLGLLLLGMLGVWRRWRTLRTDGFDLLVLGSLLFVLATFISPGTPVYDGIRLFLMVFPLWAVFVGYGAKWLVDFELGEAAKRQSPLDRAESLRFANLRRGQSAFFRSLARWQQRPRRQRIAAVGLLVAAQGIGLVVYHPCQLSYYNALVGGLPGAERLGFEMCYWGDALVEPVLAEAVRCAEGDAVLFAPSLAPFHAPGIRMSSPALADHRIELLAPSGTGNSQSQRPQVLVLYRRRADIRSIPDAAWSGKILAECRKQGVWLSRAVRLPAPRNPEETL